MSEVKRGRGRPRKYVTDEARRKAHAERLQRRRITSTAITLHREVAGLLRSCVVIKSQEVGVQLTTNQVAQMILKDWIAEHDPDGSILKESKFKGKVHNGWQSDDR